MTEIEQDKAKEWRRYVIKKYMSYFANVARKSFITSALVMAFHRVDGTFETIVIALLAFLYERLVWGFYFSRFLQKHDKMYTLISAENDGIGRFNPKDWPPEHVMRLRAFAELGGHHNINIMFSVVLNAIALYNLFRVLI